MLFDGFPLACLTAIIEPMRVANEISDQPIFAWPLISETGAKVQSSAMITVDVEASISAVMETWPNIDYLVMLSPPKAVFAHSESIGVLRHLSRHGVTFCAVSAGVFPLARTGIASAHKLSVHWCYRSAFDNEFPHLNASDQIVEIDDNFMTASGAAGGFELALKLIEDRLGGAVSTEVACWFQHPMMRKSGIQQITPAHHVSSTEDNLPPLVSRAINMMHEHIREPVSIEEIAENCEMTSRHLERVFKAATGQNPSNYYRILRTKAVRQMVLYTNEKITTIASEMGYSQTRSMRRQYIANFGVSPEEDRNQINLYRVEGNISLPSLWAKNEDNA